MMDPRTGEILALAQYPFFNPVNYQEYFNDQSMQEHAKVKAVTDANEPGSTMKPVTLAIALKANEEMKKKGKSPLFDPLEKVDTSVGNFRGRKELKDTRRHYYLNMYQALQKSSNIYMAKMIERVIENFGNQWYRDVLHDCFGFGEKTGIELPAESCGVLPQPGKKHPNGALEWSLPTPYSLAIGHNIQTTSIQMLRAYAIFANGGYLVRPTLVKKIVKTYADGEQEILLDNTLNRQASFPKVLDDSIIKEVVKAMKYVTKKGGTAQRADIFGYTEAGKTGTGNKIVNGEYSQNKHFSSFIGFAPVTQPAFILYVGIDEPEVKFVPQIGKIHLGGLCAAPVFREIARRSLEEYLGVAPDDPHGYPVGDPRYDPAKADWAQEISELQEIYDKWNLKN